MKKQPTTQQRFDSLIIDMDNMSNSAGLDPSRAYSVRTAMVSGIMACIRHLKEVHLSGGNAGQFLNEMDEICAEHMIKVAKESISKLNANAQSITDDIVKPEEN